MTGRVVRNALASAMIFTLSLVALAQTTPAELQKYQAATYPESLLSGLQQGNALLIGRIDRDGRIQDLRPVAASQAGFVAPALEAVQAWRFKPATRDGKPVDIAANVAVRFRLDNEKRGAIPQPILGDLAVFPADASGRKTAPEGFPIRLGLDPKLRAEAALDVNAHPTPRTIAVRVEATAPDGRPHILFDGPVTVPGGAAEVKVPIVAAIASDWPEGVWFLDFYADAREAGGGQFWLARDPSRFDFASALQKR